ncbi:MAG TPA: hypothetical protein VLW50_10710 [Streptosporangiaceae bacterium]|nr:hypothetical protein [Streptosporangiaceae bacterium]
MGDAAIPGQPLGDDQLDRDQLDRDAVVDAQDNVEQEPEPPGQPDPVQPDEPEEGVAEPEEHFHG